MPAKEECGVAGIYLKEDRNLELVPELLYHMMSQLQHRGQLSTGVAVYNPHNKSYEKRLKNRRAVGMVNDFFSVRDEKKSREIVKYLRGTAGIGHLRYATAGTPSNMLEQEEEAQPFLRHHPRPWKCFATAFNGNLANYDDLRSEMKREGYVLDTRVDTEIIVYLTAMYLKALSEKDERGRDIKPDLGEVVKKVMQKMDGSYNVVSLFEDSNLVVYRDPFAFKPLVWGETKDFFAVASESVALTKIGIDKFYPVTPGACIIFNKDGRLERKLIESDRTARCHFEFVYFSRAASVFDNVSVNAVRENLGRNLARDEPLKGKFDKDFVVVPVPKTAIAAAEGYARELGLPLTFALDTSQDARGFINKSLTRKRIMDLKYNIVSERVRGKKVIAVEDSYVRGETMAKIVKLLRSAGAVEVHGRSTEPRIDYPCCYGTDFANFNELIAWRNRNAENFNLAVANEIGADSVNFQLIEGLVEATGFKENELCLACLNGKYPTPAGVKFLDKKLRKCQDK